MLIIIGKVFYFLGWRFAYQTLTGTYLTAKVNIPKLLIHFNALHLTANPFTHLSALIL